MEHLAPKGGVLVCVEISVRGIRYKHNNNNKKKNYLIAMQNREGIIKETKDWNKWNINRDSRNCVINEEALV